MFVSIFCNPFYVSVSIRQKKTNSIPQYLTQKKNQFKAQLNRGLNRGGGGENVVFYFPDPEFQTFDSQAISTSGFNLFG